MGYILPVCIICDFSVTLQCFLHTVYLSNHALNCLEFNAYVSYTNQAVSKGEDDTSLENKKLPLLTDMVLYYCRHAEQSILLQLYQAKVKEAQISHPIS